MKAKQKLGKQPNQACEDGGEGKWSVVGGESAEIIVVVLLMRVFVAMALPGCQNSLALTLSLSPRRGNQTESRPIKPNQAKSR
jgi:hypothetical protein